MAWTAPMTFVGNAVLTASQLNTHIRDNMLETAPAKATEEGSWFVATALNAIVERPIRYDRINTQETTISTSFVDLATVGPSVTVTTGTSAIILYQSRMDCTSANAHTWVSFAISGATTRGALDETSIQRGGLAASNLCQWADADMITTLTAGSNTFTMKYKTEAGTATFANRFLCVIPLN